MTDERRGGMSKLDVLVKKEIERIHAELTTKHGCKFALVVMTPDREEKELRPIVSGTGESECVAHLLSLGLFSELDEQHDRFHDLAEEIIEGTEELERLHLVKPS